MRRKKINELEKFAVFNLRTNIGRVYGENNTRRRRWRINKGIYTEGTASRIFLVGRGRPYRDCERIRARFDDEKIELTLSACRHDVRPFPRGAAEVADDGKIVRTRRAVPCVVSSSPHPPHTNTPCRRVLIHFIFAPRRLSPSQITRFYPRANIARPFRALLDPAASENRRPHPKSGNEKSHVENDHCDHSR